MELEPEDYNEILNWFTHTYGKRDNVRISEDSTKTFWKLTFLVEEKIKEMREQIGRTDDE
jgi:hypothetical protein|tara:strand:+ start:4315 stop:4494 length:180 start_codon:yes stop_codon:yes gene_type:complete